MFSSLHHHNNSKIVELEEELRVVGNNLKSLEVSEEKVSISKIGFNLIQFERINERIVKLTWTIIEFQMQLSQNVKTTTTDLGQPTWGRVQEPDQDPEHSSKGGTDSDTDTKKKEP